MIFKNMSGVHGFVSFTVNVLIESLGFLNKIKGSLLKPKFTI